MKKNVRIHFVESIASGMAANIAVRDGIAGALFHDEAEFIPFDDLAYNKELGYYKISMFPDADNECITEPMFTIRPLETQRNFRGIYVLAHSDGSSYIIGERWQVAEAAAVLNQFVATGDADEPFDLRNLADMSIGEAIDYIVARGWPQSRARNALKSGATYGRIPGATKDENGYHWKFSRYGLDNWLETAKPYAVEDGNASS